jgi:putative ABC transport system ATP-binding protein
MLSCKALTFSYDHKNTLQFPDFECKEGEHMLLLGASGSGKTTLLHLLAGLLKPSGGKIEIAGTSLGELSQKKLDKFRGQKVGIVYQTAHFVKSLSVIDNLLMPQFLTGKPTQPQKAQELLDRLQIGNKAHRKPSDLSVGEQQRVAIARALINDPEVILADEPTSALDDQNAKEVLHLLEDQANAANATLVIVTHDSRLKGHFEKRIEL